MNVAVILGIIFIICLVLGIPIAISMGIASLFGFLMAKLPLSYIAQAAFTTLNSFTIIAVPMFILAGAIMEKGGLTHRLINFAKSIVGSYTGGLPIVTIIACTLFGAISGSGLATCAAIGSMMIPSMIREGYHREFAGGITACAGGIGAVIPPSILMIIYGVTSEVSITTLFIAGIFPGILLALFLIVAVIIISKRRGYSSYTENISFKGIFKAAFGAKWALLAPVVILGGIYGGIFTITEASVVAVFYALFVVSFIYRKLTWNMLFECLKDTARIAGSILLIVTTGRMFGRLLAIYHIPQATSSFLIEHIHSPILLILLIDAGLIFIGMWMESATQIIILTPLLLPVVMNLGIDPIQFGIMFVVACEIGFETPPLGINLFVASEISGATIERISKEAAIFVLAESTALVLVSLIPPISLFIPRLFGFI